MDEPEWNAYLSHTKNLLEYYQSVMCDDVVLFICD